jgi:hypothetical protein
MNSKAFSLTALCFITTVAAACLTQEPLESEDVGEAPAAIGCSIANDCPPPAGACVKAACVNGSCTTAPIAAGAPCNDPSGIGTCGSDGLCYMPPGYTACNSYTYSPSPKACATAADCEDADECTGDACVGGYCRHTQAANGSVCGSGSGAWSCSWGLCCPLPSGECGGSTAVPGNCTTSSQCDDGNPCTVDFCLIVFGSGHCVNNARPNNTVCEQAWGGDSHEGRCNAGHCCEPF